MSDTGWATVREALSDLDFPADKEQVVAHAARRTGDERALRLVRGLPLATYRNLAEVRRSVDLDPAEDEGLTAGQQAGQARGGPERVAQHLRGAPGPGLD